MGESKSTLNWIATFRRQIPLIDPNRPTRNKVRKRPTSLRQRFIFIHVGSKSSETIVISGQFKMIPTARWLQLNLGLVCLVVFFAGVESYAARQASSSASPTDSPKPAACTAPEYHQFDFWVGDWDAFDFDNPTTKVARTQVDLILEGCALRENYQATDGHQGQSFSIYDASRKVWHQTWVTNRGQLLVIEGTLEAGEMALTGVDPAAAEPTLVRGTWKPVSGGVREIGVTSTDGAKPGNRGSIWPFVPTSSNR
jgi:hypothetical protein